MKWNKRKSKIAIAVCLAIALILMIVYLVTGDNWELTKKIFSKYDFDEDLPEDLDLGLRGYVTFAILAMLQIVIAVLPAEPIQVLSAITLGFPMGLVSCMVGVLLGNTIIFILYRLFGERIRNKMFKDVKIEFSALSMSAQAVLVIFLLYFLPAIPYGLICFFAAGVGMKYPRYIAITCLGSLPSVLIGVGLGHMTLAASWIVSLSVFAVLVVLLVILSIKKDAIIKRLNDYLVRPPYSSKTTVKPYKHNILNVGYVVSRIILWCKGVRVRYIDKTNGTLPSPAIVLCNHGSFIDFVYAGSLIYKKHPHFVVARLYFYKKILGNLLRKIGCFPKSMFAADLESAKNCLRVLKNGGVLAMMPEARLSTVGRFEDIQPGTYTFLKKSGIPIYSIVIKGDYLASPKWGNGLRRGALVEAELDLLISAEELAEMSVEDIRVRVEDRLYYDEFAWLKTHPELRYRSRSMAKGLENILTTCPVCQQKYTLSTRGNDILCEKCGKIATLTPRYTLDGKISFENFADWYDWQKKKLEEEILANEDWALSARVLFRLPAPGGRKMLRDAGQGVCTLTREGLVYEGERDGESVTLRFPISSIYRLLFGSGENFEVYVGSEIHYFVPEDLRSCVEWYMASAILYDLASREKEAVLTVK